MKQLLALVAGVPGICELIVPDSVTPEKVMEDLQEMERGWTEVRQEHGPFDVRVSAITGIWVHEESALVTT